MTYDFSCLHLLDGELKLLKRLKNFPQRYNKKYDRLIREDLACFCEYRSDEIGNQIPIKNKVEITEKGLQYLAYNKEFFIVNKTPIIISIIALVFSVISLFKESIISIIRKIFELL